MGRCTVSVSAFLLLYVVFLSLAGPAAPSREAKLLPLSKLERAHLRATREAYRGVEIFKFHGAVSPEGMEIIYVWSKRLQEAECKLARDKKELVAASKGHFDRMAKLETKIRAQVWRDNDQGRRQYAAEHLFQIAKVKYYRTEAELELERVKAKR
jgi:hypothetical protein